MGDSRKIEELPNTSPVTIKKLKSLGIETFVDLLNYFPSRYEDYSLLTSVSKAQPGETVTVKGQVVDAKYQVTRTGLRIQAFKVDDGTGQIDIGFYNQPYLLRLIKKGNILSVAGVIEQYGRKIVMKPKEYEILNEDGVMKHTGKIIPVYPQLRGLSSKTIREKMYFAVKETVAESLPEKIVTFNELVGEGEAYRNVHFPKSQEDMIRARKRLSFDELFAIQLSSATIRREWETETVGYRFKDDEKITKKLDRFVSDLPFALTNSQKEVWRDIFEDLKKAKPMNRFLQGEVGSGKTVVAALASYFSYLNGYKSLIMAPTEILAGQHYKTLQKLFSGSKVKIGLKTSSSKNVPGDIIVGTHALISRKFDVKKVGLVVIDEQHRFGVAQRALLKKKGLNPHLLTMTATPIPRTVMLTLHGELDISVITEMPKGRLAVKTYLVPPHKRADGYQWIKKQIIENKTQVFVVCPLIEESEIETMKSVKASKKEFEDLKRIFTGHTVGLLHGKMKATEKDKVMTDFKNGLYDILVTTPVVEVGVDIPNATIMIIEGAERFGLAQLHQLRGRVGRGDKQSYCLLYSSLEEQKANERLEFFSKTNLGTQLAEEDMKIRGPGDIFGMKQHGFTDLKIASLADYALIGSVKKAAQYFIDHYDTKDYPVLQQKLEKLKTKEVARD